MADTDNKVEQQNTPESTDISKTDDHILAVPVAPVAPVATQQNNGSDVVDESLNDVENKDESIIKSSENNDADATEPVGKKIEGAKKVDAVDPNDTSNEYFKINGENVVTADDTPVSGQQKADLLATVKELEMGGGRRHSRRNGRRHSRRHSKKRQQKRQSKKQNGGRRRHNSKRNSKRNQKK